MNGCQARLESMEPPSVEELQAKAKSEDSVNERKRKKPSEGDSIDWSLISTELMALIECPNKTKEVIDFLQSKEKDGETMAANSDEQFVLLPALADKTTRRKLHHWVRERLSHIALSDTAEGQQIRIWHASHRASMDNPWDNPGKAKKPRPPAEYLQFVLYKENIDTGSAIQLMARRFGGGGRGRGGRGGRRGPSSLRMGYAGNKDKRGVTAQFITVRSTDCTPQSLCAKLNFHGKDGGGGHTKTEGASLVRVGNFQYVDKELRLGRLQGNRFDLVLRNLQCSDARIIPERAIKAMRDTGFINYFGTQRFGRNFDTHLVGIAVIRGDYESAIDQILSPKVDDKDLREHFEQWQSRFKENTEDKAATEKSHAQKLLASLNRFMHSESAVLKALIDRPLDYRSAFNKITKTMRMMFIHALQSYFWNKVASFRVNELGPAVALGDLVLVRDGQAETGLPIVHEVTSEDLDSKRYNFTDVVLPLIGAKTTLPSNICGTHFDELLSNHNLTREMIDNLADRDFNCSGDYRRLICRPDDVDFELLKYDDEVEPLLQTDFMKLQGINIPENVKGNLAALRVGFSLPSSAYATIFLRELMKRPTSTAYQSTLNLVTPKDHPAP